jgi:hypothetical protein
MASARTAGHGGFAVSLAVVFLFLYCVRPQDWIPGMAGVNVIRPLMVIWIGYLISTRLRSPLAGLMRTPQDWAVVVYGGYVVWNAPAGMGVGSEVFNLLVFYFLTAQSLTSWSAVFRYLKAWNLFLLIIAGFGVLQVMGMDITGGTDKTLAFSGRLSLGTWLANNPNALGHTIAPALFVSCLFFLDSLVRLGDPIQRQFFGRRRFDRAIVCRWSSQMDSNVSAGCHPPGRSRGPTVHAEDGTDGQSEGGRWGTGSVDGLGNGEDSHGIEPHRCWLETVHCTHRLERRQ